MENEYFGLNYNDYNDLLACNFNDVKTFDKDMLLNEIDEYKKAMSNGWKNYDSVSSLSDWSVGKYVYPDIQHHHKKIVDKTKELNVKSICEAGAGGGVVAKHVYTYNDYNIDLTCVEGSDIHIGQMRENFSKESNIVLPQIDVKANIVKGVIQDIPLDDNLFDLVYTCTVMMHIPYLMIPKSMIELVRISKKYIMHVENKNNMINAVCMGNQKSDSNRLIIDYKKMYNKLGVKCLEYYEYKDEHVDCEYLFFLGEKI
jgi:ubiquinone/menaquinone biosynthesis C-methylase UbiE